MVANMDARPDRWILNLKCPECGQAGVIHFMEDTHPYLKGEALVVEYVTPGFDLIRIGTAGGGTVVLCSDCEEEAF